MLESKVERHLIRQVKRSGGRTFKLKFISVVGAPDRLVLYKGVHFVETKRPKKGVLSPLQRRAHRILREYGASVVVLQSQTEVDQWILDLDLL